MTSGAHRAPVFSLTGAPVDDRNAIDVARSSHFAAMRPGPAGLLREQPVATELRHRGVHGECTPQISREPEMEHLAPLRLLHARRARAVGPRREPSLDALHADDVRMPARQRASRRWPQHAARHAEHGADEPRLPSRLGRVDQRLRSARVEVVVISTVSAVLCVEVSDRVIAWGTSCEVGIEAVRGRRTDITPSRRGHADAAKKGRRSTSLRGRCQRDIRVLAKVVRETAQRPRGKCFLAGLQRAQRRGRCSRHR